MNAITQNSLTELKLGLVQRHRNILVFPLLSPVNGECHWLTLGEALGSNRMMVTEVSQSGSVPQLKVMNQSDRPVLILDGEELIGAKQNRILNTTILLKENSETIVPVSCTEQGRWSNISVNFADAGVVMSRKIRALKSRSVSQSLAADAGYESNQGEVWREIEALQASSGTKSPTGAMQDVFKARERDLKECLDIFTVAPGQTGLLVLIEGEIAGFDLIPHSRIYALEHSKLIKSYVIEALIGSVKNESKAVDLKEVEGRAEDFFRTVKESDEQSFPSIGYGTDYRFKRTGIAGAGLVHQDRVVHTSFFMLPKDSDSSGSIASLRQRRSRQTPRSD